MSVRILGEGFFDLGGEFEGEGVEALRQITNELQEIVVGDQGRDGGEEACGSGDERFGDAGCHGAKAGGSRGAQAGEGVNDAPDRAKEADERSDGGRGGQPGHALFGATHFVGGGKLHIYGNRLETFHFLRRGIAGWAGDLALQFAIARGVDFGKWRAGGDEPLRIGHAFRGAEDFQELIAFATDAAEKAELLEDQSPGHQRKEEKNTEHDTSDDACFVKYVQDVANEQRG